MKNQFLFVFLALFLAAGCQKEDSIISGRVSYKGAITGIEYAAPNVQVKLHLGDVSASPYATTTTDSEGYYQFHGLWKAHWYISSAITVNTFNYSGAAGTTQVDGKNAVTLNLIME